MLQILREHLQRIYSVLKFSQILFAYTAEVTKKNIISRLLTKIKSTESYTRDMVLKFLPEPIHELNILQKNYQALYQHDKLITHLSLHELAYLFKVQDNRYCMSTFLL